MNKRTRSALIQLWLIALVLVNAWLMTQSVILMDSARDFSYALDIVQGRLWHLMGPEFGGFVHTGPIWFYLLSLPLLSGSLWLTAFFIGLLAGLKFVLAFYLGKEWVNSRFGLLWSVCFLLPGWYSINTFIPGHINVIDTLVLAFVGSLWIYLRTNRVGWLYLSGFMLSLAMHAHVTALIAVILYLPVMWQMKSHVRFRQLSITALLFLLPFVPYFISQFLDGWGDWARWQTLTQTIDQAKRGLVATNESFLVAFIGNLQASVLGGLQRLQGFVASVWPILGVMYWLLIWVLVLVASGHWIYRLSKGSHNHHPVKILMWALVLWLVGVALITALRSFTPFYMLFVLTPLLTFLWAWLLSVGGQLRSSLNWVVVAVIVVLGSFPVLSLQKAVYDGQVHLGPLGNVRQSVNNDWQTDHNTLDALTVADSDVLGDFLCRHKVQIHGPGAAMLDLLSALPMRIACPQQSVLLGGKPQQGFQQILLMHRSFWDKISLLPESWVTPAWGVSENIVTNNEYQALQPVDFDDYIHPPRSLREKQTMQSFTKQFHSEKNSVLLITHLLPFYTTNYISEVTANGHKMEKLMANIGNSLYYCAACEPGPVTWQITFRSNDPAALDMMILKTHE